MKNVIVVRHAKSSWENPGLRDFDRPLNQRGHRDAPRMAEYIAQKVPHIDRILTSSAVRTRQTAEYFARAYGLSEMHVIPLDALYYSDVEQYEAQMRMCNDDWQTVMLIGHNPIITHIANEIQPGLTAKVPTCGVLWGTVDIDHWRDFDFSKVVLQEYVYPKMLPHHE